MPEPFFGGPGINRADLLRVDEEQLARLRDHPAARALRWEGGAPALKADGRLHWQPLGGNEDIFLGLDGDAPCFAALPGFDSLPQNAYSLFPLLGMLHGEDAPLFAAALSLAHWHAAHGYCPACGGQTEANRAGWGRSCNACARAQFPRVDPVVIMLAEHDGQLLLGRQPQYPTGRYSALAGFLEPGETMEAAVARELHEEAGIRVGRVSYLASQPWPFPYSLMIGAHAEALDGTLTIDRTELDDARWFSREEVLDALAGADNAAFAPPPTAAIARTLLEAWANGLK